MMEIVNWSDFYIQNVSNYENEFCAAEQILEEGPFPGEKPREARPIFQITLSPINASFKDFRKGKANDETMNTTLCYNKFKLRQG